MPPFLAMGKYAAFVWPAYGISALGILAAVVLSMRAYYRAKTRLSAAERNQK
ncbi:MAG TPA: heme exporter protein CcmD [Rhizomicrobium sp.]|jgi:heme exporter protein CcmD|nr:heme exporter protein CcmD [Rhizomicrobium sp.]